MRDPYQIYAKKILELEPLEPVDAAPGGAERGTFIHAALEKFGKEFRDALPDHAAERLLDFGRDALRLMRVPQEVEAFWWPRFEKIAEVFVEQEREWRGRATPFLAETRGQWGFETQGGVFTLSGRADRIDRFADGTYAVIDYKTGVAPDNTAVRNGLSPQLPLEALMLEKGGFPGAPARPATALVYWQVKGGGAVPVVRAEVKAGEGGIAELVRDAEEGLKALVEKFDNEKVPYRSRPLSYAPPRYSDYDHLARVREWAVAGEEEE
jgi:ATP-dependent helicase/nuclease subunit B